MEPGLAWDQNVDAYARSDRSLLERERERDSLYKAVWYFSFEASRCNNHVTLFSLVRDFPAF